MMPFEISKLKKIQLDNAKWEKLTPYNFCDRWCERCPSLKKDGCKLYQEEFDAKLQFIADGKDWDKWQTVFEVVKKKLHGNKTILAGMTEQADIPLYDFDEEFLKEHEDMSKKVYQHPLFKKAMDYGTKTSQFIEESLRQEEDALAEAISHYEALMWYHTLLPSKIQRVILSLFKKRSGIEKHKNVEEFYLNDVVAQIGICLKSTKESQEALAAIFSMRISLRYTIADLKGMLIEIEKKLQDILLDIDLGKV
jgi:hypothetical protein